MRAHTNSSSQRWWVVTAALMCGCVCLSGCKKNDTSNEGVAAVSVQAEHPTVGPLSAEIQADAILAPLAEAAIEPRISAPIRAEYVQRGAHVHKGQLLMTLEDRDLQGNALDSQGNLTAAQAQYRATTQATIPEDTQKAQLDVDQAKANLAVAKRTATERERLFHEGALAGRDADLAAAAEVQAQATYDSAQKHLQSVQNTTKQTTAQTARGQVTSARGRLINAEAQVSYAHLRAPIDGVVTERPLFPGETAAAGTPAITIMDISSLVAKLHIAQAAAQNLTVGGEAEIQVPGIEQPQTAMVSLISPTLDPGSTTVEVWLKLPNPGGRYKVGTAVHAVIHGYAIPNAVQLPPAAILPADDGSTAVLVVGPDSIAHKRTVRIGIRTPDKVQILSGVTPGDLVVTEGGYGLDDGTRVVVGGASENTSAGGSSD